MDPLRAEGWLFVNVFIRVYFFGIYSLFQQYPGVNATQYVNIALHKPTKQIDTASGRDSSRANDGIADGNAAGGSCSSTKTFRDTWWTVDLLFSRTVFAINMKNRNKETFKALKDFYIYVSERNPLPLPPADGNFSGEVCLFHSGFLKPNGIQFLPCSKPIRGRFVYIWKPGKTGALLLCEVEVLSTPEKFIYTITRNKQSRDISFYTETLDSGTHIQCVATCRNLKEITSSVIQFNRNSKECSCFNTKPFEDNTADTNVTFHHHYDIIKLDPQ